jgi:hypothetical protein
MRHLLDCNACSCLYGHQQNLQTCGENASRYRPVSERHFTQKMHLTPKSFIIRALKTKDLRIAPQLARFVSIRPLQTVERRINKR